MTFLPKVLPERTQRGMRQQPKPDFKFQAVPRKFVQGASIFVVSTTQAIDD
jgi:hypothetical protein